MSERRALMGTRSGGSSGGSIKKSVYTFTASGAVSNNVAVNEPSASILFCHFYDTEAVYTTNNTTYEGYHLGPAAAHFLVLATQGQWNIWRTNSTGSTTGFNNYGNNNPFETEGTVKVSANPNLASGASCVLEVYYVD